MSTRIHSLVRTLREDHGSGRDPVDETGVEPHVDAAVGWLCRSQDATDGGGSAACYNLVLGWEDAYPETTGYIVPTLYDVADRFDRPALADRAERMASWLVDVQLESGAFPAGTYDGTATEPSVFNTGQVLRGLVRGYRETGNERYREAAVSAVEWLERVQEPDGSWRDHDYNGVSHAYASRISWPVLEVADAFGVDSGREVAEANLQWVLAQQDEAGWFEKCGFEHGADPFLHTIAYTVRGLLESTEYLDTETGTECREAGLKTARRLLDRQRRNGVLEGAFRSGFEPVSDYYCLIGNAQLAVVWAWIADRERDDRYRKEVSRTVRFLQRQQTLDGPDPVRGGLRGSAPVWGKYMYLRYPNWACKFLVDALLSERALRQTDDD